MQKCFCKHLDIFNEIKQRNTQTVWALCLSHNRPSDSFLCLLLAHKTLGVDGFDDDLMFDDCHNLKPGFH